ncbi:MAG: hypothetical protein AAGA85_17740, partial [Bacteroidota bacterium]
MKCLLAMLLMGWTTSLPGQGNNYPFGFQGMERDDDIQGKGNTYHTFYRPFDARRGMWSSVDPLRSP